MRCGRPVQALGHPVQLRHAVPAAQRPGVARAEPVGGPGQLLQRPGQPPGLQQRQHDGHRHREQRQAADQQRPP